MHSSANSTHTNTQTCTHLNPDWVPEFRPIYVLTLNRVNTHKQTTARSNVLPMRLSSLEVVQMGLILSPWSHCWAAKPTRGPKSQSRAPQEHVAQYRVIRKHLLFYPATLPDVCLSSPYKSTQFIPSVAPCFITMFGFDFFVVSSVCLLSLNLQTSSFSFKRHCPLMPHLAFFPFSRTVSSLINRFQFLS